MKIADGFREGKTAGVVDARMIFAIDENIIVQRRNGADNAEV